MGKTASQTAISTNPTSVSVAVQPKPARPRGPGWYLYQVLKGIASLRLTVVLLVFSIGLIFFGTLAQVDGGIWTIVHKYFRTFFVWVPLQIFFPRDLYTIRGGFPYPGGYIIGGLLLINLLTAHAIRFKISWRRSGILLIHSGLIIMLLGELITGLFAVESNMTLAEGETVNYVDVPRETELAFVTPSAGDPKSEDVVVIPGSVLRNGGTIRNDRLPVDVEVIKYMKNSFLKEAPEEIRGTGEAVRGFDGHWFTVSEQPEETGVAKEQREDAAAVLVNFKKKGTDEVVGKYMLSVWYYPNYSHRTLRFRPQQLSVDETTYDVSLRFKRVYKPFDVHLIDFSHKVYKGTTIPKDYASQIRLSDQERGHEREVRIQMNDPLRYRGETFYQSGFLPNDQGTVLQVVRNPGWLMPYVSCVLVSLGMVIHFSITLVNFLRRRAAL